MSTLHAQRAIVVVKLGGSVLTDSAAYARCAAALRDRLRQCPTERLVVVVSAQYGTTDELAALAAETCAEPDSSLLDLLWSTGELRSVALLALALRRLDIAAIALNVHQCGVELRVPGATDPARAHVNPLPLLGHLRRHPVVVVPGFFARVPGDSVVSLGRGGSDLTAVLLAAGLGARRCELIKDVPGYFSQDPNRCADAVPLPHLSYAAALALADAGCDLVQGRALAAAAESGTPLLIRALADGGPWTWVGGPKAAANAVGAAVAV